MAKIKHGLAALTMLREDSLLPLTCARLGACCQNKDIRLNPCEIALLAEYCGMSAPDFLAAHTLPGGLRLRMGASGGNGRGACCLYEPDAGCRAHPARPLACRLYPLGRRLRAGEVAYFHEGREFPCLKPCSPVRELPQLTVAEYLRGQEITQTLRAQELYLEIVQELAEGALVLLLDSGLAASGERQTLGLWRAAARMNDAERAGYIGHDWLHELLIPQLSLSETGVEGFATAHHRRMQERAQREFASLASVETLREASARMMTLALHLACGCGIEPREPLELWLKTARTHGAQG